MLTPLDIRKKEFRRCFRGYDEQEVDRFLDLVIDTMERLIEQKNDLQEQLERMEGMVARYTELEEVLKSTMVIAQQTANEIKESANREARNILDEAKAKAEKLVAHARGEAQVILNRAHDDGAQVLDEAGAKADRIMEEYGVLQKQAGLFRAKFRSFLEVQLELLESELGLLDDQHRPALADAGDGEWEDYDFGAEGAPDAAVEVAAANGAEESGGEESPGREQLS